LWTRLAPEPTSGGGMPDADVPVRWELARDEGLREVVAEGVATATTAHGHSVHVDVDGLDPVTTYWYRFTVGDFESPVGRTRTLPAPGDSTERLAFAFASCQNRQDGYWTAYPHLVEEDLDFVLFLGDYIYESGPNPAKLRPHPPQAQDLAGYRDRYGLYKGDPGLQAAHAAYPWLVIWDDHEVDNDYAGDVPEEPDEAFLERRAVAYQVWWEHNAVRLDPPDGAELVIHRSFEVGDLARIFLLDGRQYRSDQPCEADIGPVCEAGDDPARTLLGDEQESWLFEGLDRSDARWNVLAQPVVMSKVAIPLGETTLFNLDQWDGYVPARTRLLDHLGQGQATNPIVLSGDIHVSGVGDLMADFDDPGSEVVGAEFVVTSISSLFEPAFIDIFEAALAANPHVKYGEARSRGYVRCEVTPESWRADFRYVDGIDTETSPIRTASSWVVEDGRPGVRSA
ncbi:MAG: alkaline phosphatase D family protein, partial [Acidimicrobiia bacterium]|nr:alkaline phosphatase D family protein [Acidimicrobiia bacterium]